MLMIVINLIIIAFAITALVIGGGQLVYISYILGQTSAALNIPLAYIYLILPISGILVSYYKIMDLIALKQESGSGASATAQENQ